MRHAIFFLLLLPASAAAQGVTTTRHNLSVSGPGPIKATDQTQVCIFCHVPHRGLSGGGSRVLSQATYTPYASSTLVSPAPGQPSGTTRVCLSCHDGTIALGETVAGRFEVDGGSAGRLATSLGVDLRGTHPVSFAPAAAPSLRMPPAGDAVKLDDAGRVQCTSCHDPHQEAIDPLVAKFLVKDNRASAICTTCHTLPGWGSNPAAHQSSNRPFDPARGARTDYGTVADNGCLSCHRSHGATPPERLLDGPEAPMCLRCHDGRVAGKDVAAELAKTYVHPVLTSDPALHDASEGPGSDRFALPERNAAQRRHVTCSDCHDAHAAYASPAAPPLASGALAGAWGIGRDGARVDPVVQQYELCFKCHADSANQPQALGPSPPETVRRAVVDPNLRRRLDLSAASFHPVEGEGRSTDVPGLIAPLTTGSIIACGDCHASDAGPGAGGVAPAGPHGSSYPHILERGFATADRTVESPAAYALCYKCHDRDVLLSDASHFRGHRRHVVDNQTPCSACHDWHGVSTLQGNPVNNAHLIDFDVAIVQPNAQGVRQYATLGPGSGVCYLSCHGREHSYEAYVP